MCNFAIMSLWRYIGRARASRGFGVHSPMAFSFICGPLRDTSAAYYVWPELERLSRTRAELARARRLTRVACFAGRGTTEVCGDPGEAMRAALRAAGGNITVVAAGPLPALPPPGEDLHIVALYDMSLWPGLLEASPGLAFSNGREGYLLRRRDLPTRMFEINMR